MYGYGVLGNFYMTLKLYMYDFSLKYNVKSLL